MANFVRLAKSGNEWRTNELLDYNISIVEQYQQAFFGGPLPDYTGPAGFIQHEDRVQGFDASTLALVKRLDLAMKVMEGEDSAVNDFAAEILRALGYETEQMAVRTRKSIRLSMCREEVYAKTDVCIQDVDSDILLLVQEDKTHISPTGPEAQLVAEEIAAFQTNNANRANNLFLETLQSQVILGNYNGGIIPVFL